MMETASVDAICAKLRDRFRPDCSDSLDFIKTSNFTLLNIIRGEDITSFIRAVIRNAKGCNLDHGQLIAAFEALDVDIQTELIKPTAATSVDSLLQDIRSRDSVIRLKAQRRFPRTSTGPNYSGKPAYSGQSQPRSDMFSQRQFPTRSFNTNQFPQRQQQPQTTCG